MNIISGPLKARIPLWYTRVGIRCLVMNRDTLQRPILTRILILRKPLLLFAKRSQNEKSAMLAHFLQYSPASIKLPSPKSSNSTPTLPFGPVLQTNSAKSQMLNAPITFHSLRKDELTSMNDHIDRFIPLPPSLTEIPSYQLHGTGPTGRAKSGFQRCRASIGLWSGQARPDRGMPSLHRSSHNSEFIEFSLFSFLYFCTTISLYAPWLAIHTLTISASLFLNSGI
jgi:hypothetical protein